MRRSKMFGVALVAMLVISGLATASSFAVEAEFSPAPNAIKEVKSGAGELSGGPLPINCKKDEGGEAGGKGGTVSTAKSGSFDVLFLECSTAGGLIKCKALTDSTAGSILVKGKFEPVYALEKGTKADEDPAIVFKIEPVHIECGTELAVVEGSVCGLIKPVNTNVPVGSAFTVTVLGKEAEETYSKVKGATTGLLECKLTESRDGKEAKQAFEKTTEEIFLEKAAELKA